MIGWIVWAFVLIVQQLAHGLSSRAKNRDNYTYNILASVLSNGVWICSNFFIVGSVLDVIKSGNVRLAVFTVAFYTFFAVLGSVLAQWTAIEFIEKRFT